MIITIISILLITPIIWLVSKKLKFKICPICAGVSLTWFWLLVGIKLNLLSSADYQLPTAILMGGTVVGLMFKLEQFIKIKFVLIWKTLFVVLGFMVVHSLMFANWMIFLVSAILVVLLTFILKVSKTTLENQKLHEVSSSKELEEKMKNCC
ncbi:MAG: hypothetical protein AAB501_02585 [Patescibacteria group bacterium]